jgi:GntR family transcriptional regulator
MIPLATIRRYAATVLQYMRVAEAIAGQIETGELRPGDKLPPETAIAEEYGVSVSTARRATRELRDRGLIETRWGYGTFVQKPAQ